MLKENFPLSSFNALHSILRIWFKKRGIKGLSLFFINLIFSKKGMETKKINFFLDYNFLFSSLLNILSGNSEQIDIFEFTILIVYKCTRKANEKSHKYYFLKIWTLMSTQGDFFSFLKTSTKLIFLILNQRLVKIQNSKNLFDAGILFRMERENEKTGFLNSLVLKLELDHCISCKSLNYRFREIIFRLNIFHGFYSFFPKNKMETKIFVLFLGFRNIRCAVNFLGIKNFRYEENLRTWKYRFFCKKWSSLFSESFSFSLILHLKLLKNFTNNLKEPKLSLRFFRTFLFRGKGAKNLLIRNFEKEKTYLRHITPSIFLFSKKSFYIFRFFKLDVPKLSFFKNFKDFFIFLQKFENRYFLPIFFFLNNFQKSSLKGSNFTFEISSKKNFPRKKLLGSFKLLFFLAKRKLKHLKNVLELRFLKNGIFQTTKKYYLKYLQIRFNSMKDIWIKTSFIFQLPKFQSWSANYLGRSKSSKFDISLTLNIVNFEKKIEQRNILKKNLKRERNNTNWGKKLNDTRKTNSFDSSNKLKIPVKPFSRTFHSRKQNSENIKRKNLLNSLSDLKNSTEYGIRKYFFNSTSLTIIFPVEKKKTHSFENIKHCSSFNVVPRHHLKNSYDFDNKSFPLVLFFLKIHEIGFLSCRFNKTLEFLKEHFFHLNYTKKHSFFVFTIQLKKFLLHALNENSTRKKEMKNGNKNFRIRNLIKTELQFI